MIEASFDRMSRAAAISGVYQYDTGQRLRLNGLPSPDDIAGEDDLLSGELVTVQVHFSYPGDSQAEASLAQWDAERGAWMADVPDEYLTRSEAVYVHVYMYYGAFTPEVMYLGAETETRACTMYEGVFTPISRPAPSGTVTQEQAEAWAAYTAEIDLTLASAEESAEKALASAAQARESAKTVSAAAETTAKAGQEVQDAYDALTAATGRVTGGEQVVVDLPAGSTPSIEYGDGVVTYGIPQGEKGSQGDAGADGPSDITITFTDGALTITPKEG